MTPRYFGKAEEQLLGIHHLPVSVPVRDLGIVLCPPLGHESVGALRTFRVIGARLSQAGFHALRFDYFGTGDSAGDGKDAGAGRWIEDVEAALDEVRHRGGVLRTALIGLRLGATLAALAAARRKDVECLVLWEPVPDGAAWLAECRARHRAWLEVEVRARPAARSLAGDDQEILGYPMSPATARSLEGLSLACLPVRPARRVLVIGRREEPRTEELVHHLEELGSEVDRLDATGPPIWNADVGFDQALVPVDIVQSIRGWVLRVNA